MRSCQREIAAFMRAVGQAIPDRPYVPHADVVALRRRLLRQEYEELDAALALSDLAGVADGCVDLVYVAVGAALSHGIDSVPVWGAVHGANMLKVGGPRDAFGKALKPPGWAHPDVGAILARQPPRALEANFTFANIYIE